MMNCRKLALVTNAAVLALSLGLAAVPARAEDKAPPAPPSWWDTFKYTGYLEAGITGNPDDPSNGINFGHLYTDRANLPVLNQASVILTRALDPKATGPDFGFTFQPMFGTDARYTHFYNEFDRSINSRYQFDIVEADVIGHLPYLTEGGIDLKLGQYPTPIGYEVINPTGNPLYTHSYIYNFSIPIKHTGLLTTTHVNPLLDFYLGFDTGNLGWVGEKGIVNDNPFHVLGGVGLNFLDGNLTVLALTHVGPENPDTAFFAAGFPGVRDINGTNRYFNDIVVTLKWNDDLTFTTELNYVKDDISTPGFKQPDAYGISQYVTYALNDMFTLQGRGEIWRDSKGFFAFAFPGNFDFTNAGRGLPNTSFNAGGTTYEEVTLGLNIKPATPEALSRLSGILFRPEIRYDHADTKPFNSLRSDHQVTIAGDLILSF
jgi:putative OmpL-like beta-barrel porin-2